MNHRKALVCGDVHGNPYHLTYLFETALNLGADCLIQVGDWGLWEHYDDGAFLDLCSDLATHNEIPVYWIDGNHENFDILFKVYGPGGPHYKPTPEGFWEIRQGVFYVPRGTRWEWCGVHLMGLGGAYSIDKYPREQEERKILRSYEARLEGGQANPDGNRLDRLGARLAAGEHVSWWPQEEISDADVAKALQSDEPIDILFTHDKPLRSEPGWGRRVIKQAVANQSKIQAVVDALKPTILFHGHLHHPYRDLMRGDGFVTEVVSLNCDLDPASYEPSQLYTNREINKRLEESWVLLDLAKVKGYTPQ